ncbi:MAG: TolC family protein [Campylobacteraceae bacterium]|jgi:outer membrane protein TolC|nr:TolC family protein [Campylobacteraceae bacterium]MBT4030101.1 TolC family protein [Campylobacteraceae bacterium]MBT4179832.1 TolC family protein [Campylobacteraceae bacterium]MBT4571973.1 TolC family protein [Campylobacteraceae bacterium]MBT4707195.1 TolC family protein [Campylobacteraceae bacterium]
MKDLLDWKKQLQVFKYLFFISFFISTLLSNENVLSQKRSNSLNLSQQKIDLDSAKQTIDWINPINFSYKKNILVPTRDTSNFIIPNTKVSTISINQPIFKSGGIYNAIKYSQASKQYQTLDIDSQRKVLIKDVTLLLFQLHQIDLNIKKQFYKIKNATIDVSQKKEQVLNNILDLSFLNNSIITLNNNKLSLEDLNLNKQDLLNKFNNLSSKQYSNFELPTFNIIKKEDFIQKNIYIKKSKINEKSLNYLKNVTLSQYLPTISLTHDYVNYHDRDIDTSTTGIKISIPLDVKSYYDTQSSKVSYLKSKLDTSIIEEEENNYINTKLAKVNIINKKINIQKSNILYYTNLIKEMSELSENGLKTLDDVIILQNSKAIALLELNIFKIDKQIQLLEIYARTN